MMNEITMDSPLFQQYVNGESEELFDVLGKGLKDASNGDYSNVKEMTFLVEVCELLADAGDQLINQRVSGAPIQKFHEFKERLDEMEKYSRQNEDMSVDEGIEEIKKVCLLAKDLYLFCRNLEENELVML